MEKDRLVLFSVPSPEIKREIQGFVFPEFLQNRVMVYMPSDGSDKESVEKYSKEWEEYARENRAEFEIIDNSQRGEEALAQASKLDRANILVISGGNTFKLMQHLRESGFDAAIKFFREKGGIIVAFSAGAIVLSPSLETATISDNIETGLTDLTGLNIIDFLVVPHAENKQAQIDTLLSSGKKVKAIRNNEFFVI